MMEMSVFCDECDETMMLEANCVTFKGQCVQLPLLILTQNNLPTQLAVIEPFVFIPRFHTSLSPEPDPYPPRSPLYV